MKKLVWATGATVVLLLLGAGCAEKPSTETPPAESTNTNNSSAFPNIVQPTVSDLKDLPAAVSPKTPIDDSTWVATTTKSGITIKTPGKGATTPTTWTYTLLKNDDPHLQGNCFLTEKTVYKQADEKGCLTTTELVTGPGERTDYFVFDTIVKDSKGKETTQTNMFTFNKKYAANFDMNAYGAALEHIVAIIK